MLADKYGTDPIQFWRTASGNEVDFVLSDISKYKAFEVKFERNQIRANKYNLFKEAYPEIPIEFIWLNPFDHDFFRRGF